MHQYICHPYPVDQSARNIDVHAHPDVTTHIIFPPDNECAEVGTDDYSISATTTQSLGRNRSSGLHSHQDSLHKPT